jgi:peptidoglycan LD-endopeptidase LytH
MLRIVLAVALAAAAGALIYLFASARQPVRQVAVERSRAVESPPVPDTTAYPVGRLSPPIAGLKVSDIHDTFDQAREAGARRHEATDIMAARGTPVLAMDDGTIRKLFDSRQGGLTIYLFDKLNRYCYYYAHLDRYAEGLQEGQTVSRGTVIGYVGSTGNADPSAPHLHLAIYELGPEKNWAEGNTPLNPYPLLLSLVDP